MSSHHIIKALPITTFLSSTGPNAAKDILARDRVRATKLIAGLQPHGPQTVLECSTSPYLNKLDPSTSPMQVLPIRCKSASGLHPQITHSSSTQEVPILGLEQGHDSGKLPAHSKQVTAWYVVMSSPLREKSRIWLLTAGELLIGRVGHRYSSDRCRAIGWRCLGESRDWLSHEGTGFR